MRGCCAQGTGDEHALPFSAGQGVERPIGKLFGLGQPHGFPGDTVVFPTLYLESVPSEDTCP